MASEQKKVELLHSELPDVFKNQSVPDDWADGFVQIPGADAMLDLPVDWTSIESYIEWKQEKEELRQNAIDDLNDDNSELPTDDHASDDPLVEQEVLENDSYIIPFRTLPEELLSTRPGSPVAEVEQDTQTPPDAWACYMPFHEFYPKWWGIYITYDGIRELGSTFYEKTGKALDYPLCLNIAKDYLFYHEQFHSNVENFAAHLELTHRKPLYETGFRQYYVETYMKDECLEEALAEVHAYDHIKRKYKKILKNDSKTYRAMKRVLFEHIGSNPPGYKKAAEIIHDESREEYRNLFLDKNSRYCFNSQYRDKSVWSLYDYALSPFIKINYRTIYLIRRGSRAEERIGLSH